MGIQTLGVRASALFGDGSLTVDTVRWPRTASEALRALATHYEHWRRGVRSHQPADEASFTTLLLHMNRELIHYGAEVMLMRDLYRVGRRLRDDGGRLALASLPLLTGDVRAAAQHAAGTVR